ncbi:NAD(P)/FAD-dependent oxidoreductase [Actinoallomurus oryzae]|uniref:NAD(P)/FAD-dependent oxidoreductase n=1 Tax=Actinoallomurus oryzae TaxID=502180 RepID=A0ABP8Q0E9_9ACTN
MKLAIIGSGFAGLGMAIQLKKAGFDDFVVLEKNDDLGGTWRDNRYPGCACDVPSHMYSFSYELNPGWSRMFAPQEEIWAYLRRCVDKYGLAPHIRYGAAVDSLEWDEEARHWRVALGDGTVLTPRAVVSGIGALHVPSLPDIPGAERFTGTAFHSAQWDHGCDLTGKRVAVIGTGASAIQFVPKVAERAASLRVFQRTPPWIQPKPDFVFPAWARAVFRHVPGATRAFRDTIYWVLEARAVGFTISPKLMAPQEKVARVHIAHQVPDPELRAKVTPDYTIGCKRILLSSDYYPALSRPHVDVVTDDITEITETGLVTADGTAHDVDVIIYGTGFRVTDALAEQRIVGRGGVKIQEAWADGIEAHHGVTIAGFPNLFMLLGPNTGLGHNSVVFMIESQVQHVLSCLRLLSEEKADVIEVRPEAQRRFNRGLQRRLRKAVWNEGGCRSWYLDDKGVNRTLWPGFTFEYWARTRKARRRDYALSR